MLGAVADNVDHVSAREEAWPLPTPESPAAGRSRSAALVRPGTRAALSARTTRGVSEKAEVGTPRPLYCSAAPAGAVNGPPVREAPRASSGVCART